MELNVFEMLLQKMVPYWFVSTLLKTSISVLTIKSTRKRKNKMEMSDISAVAKMLSKQAFCSI
jgi:hypothetical protein